MMWYGDGGSWFFWLAMSVMMLAFWGGLIVLVVWIVRCNREPARPKSGAAAILEERFARGEIDAEELESRRKVLQRT